MTQLSGKTTGVEALVARGDVVAVTFLTKRGEKGFRNQREIQPYFREQKKGNLIDWQYVEAIVEATMGEKMKIERSFIIDCCNGSPRRGVEPATSLEEVYANFKAAQEDSTRGLDISIFTNLAAYFDIILPQIRKYDFASKLNLVKGFNVMNLIGMENEMQQLVIESTISYILNNLKDTVIVLPEAHKFIPQGLKTPVKKTALLYAREGATNRNYMWIDTQETTSVSKAILKQCSNWIMGYQQEKNEVANVRENIGRRKISEEMIMSLQLGHFIASLHQKIYHVYILPAGIEEEVGRAVAMGKISVQEVRDGLEMRESKIIIKEPEPEERRKVRSEVSSELNGRFPTSQEYMKIRTELGEANRKVLEQEEELAVAKIELQRTVEKLEAKAQGLQDEVDELAVKAEGIVAQNKQLKTQIKEKDWAIDNLKKDLEIERGAHEELRGEHERFVAFDNALKILIDPYIERFLQDSTLPEILLNIENKDSIRGIVREELQKMTPRARARITSGDTGIAWVDIWLSKVGAAEEKILRFMAAKFPMKMTKSEIAIGVGLTAKGGYFSAGFNKLRKNRLIVADGDDWKLSEGPP